MHFHIGASLTTMTYFGTYPWESQDDDTKLAIGGTLLFIGNARVVTNIILSGMLDRHPKLKMVSVESGVGWIPFILEALDYEMSENAPKQLDQLSMLPSEYFKRNLFATFWFEKNNLPALDRRRSARTTSCSRPTSPTRPASTPSRSTRWPRRCRPCRPRCSARSWARTPPSSTGCNASGEVPAPSAPARRRPPGLGQPVIGHAGGIPVSSCLTWRSRPLGSRSMRHSQHLSPSYISTHLVFQVTPVPIVPRETPDGGL